MAKVDYLTILEEAWMQHLAYRELNAPTVISLFAGCGGSSLGYSMAGYRKLLASDFDERCAITFHLNFPDVPFLIIDIRELTVKEMMKRAGLSKSGELDVLDGSPPCQGFSTAGKRNLWDPRNELYREFVRLLEGARPKVFVMENVSGMVKGKMKLAFADCMRILKAAGYWVSCRLIDSKWFNVPQSRERLIWIGIRKDLGMEPNYPKAENKPITVRQAWNGLVNLQDELEYAKLVIQSRGNSIAPILKQAKQGQQLSKIEKRGFYFNWQRLHLDRPSPTIPKEDINLCHPIEMRILTPSECKRLSSFPDEFRFVGKPKEKRAQIGNSVPPLFMKAIAQHIRQEILSRIQNVKL